MSQQPPYPPQGPQGFPGGYQPPGFNPGNPQNYSLPGVTRTSAAAITSLIFGLLGMCIPVVSGIVAVITGIVGISATSNPSVKGRPMAVIGLIFGLLSLLVWGTGGIWFSRHLELKGPTHDFVAKYFDNVQSGNYDAALADSTAAVTDTALKAEAAKTQNWGTLNTRQIVVVNDIKNMDMAIGTCQFSTGQHKFQMILKHDPTGALKVDSFMWTQ
jgi:hypothetical protein